MRSPRSDPQPLQNTGVLCCDIQERFRKAISSMDSVLACSKWMLASANELKMPVIFTEQYPKGLGATCEELQGELESAFRVEKTKFSMVTPEVVTYMDSKLPQIDTWIIVGVETHVCVQQTAIDLLEKGNNVYVLADACSSQKPSDRRVALGRLSQLGACVTTTESAVFELLGDFAHPSAKKLSKLGRARPDSGLDAFPVSTM